MKGRDDICDGCVVTGRRGAEHHKKTIKRYLWKFTGAMSRQAESSTAREEPSPEPEPGTGGRARGSGDQASGVRPNTVPWPRGTRGLTPGPAMGWTGQFSLNAKYWPLNDMGENALPLTLIHGHWLRKRGIQSSCSGPLYAFMQPCNIVICELELIFLHQRPGWQLCIVVCRTAIYIHHLPPKSIFSPCFLAPLNI